MANCSNLPSHLFVRLSYLGWLLVNIQSLLVCLLWLLVWLRLLTLHVSIKVLDSQEEY